MTEASPIIYCANHPQVETSLRCSRCEKPICSRCAVLTPTGYRCKECVRGQQKVFESALRRDYVVAFIIAFLLSFLGAWFIPDFILFALLLSPVAGGLIAEVVRLAVRRRRSPNLFKTAAVGSLLGGLIVALGDLAIYVYYMIVMGGFNIGFLQVVLGYGLYIALVTTSTYYRLTGFQIRA